MGESYDDEARQTGHRCADMILRNEGVSLRLTLRAKRRFDIIHEHRCSQAARCRQVYGN